VWVRSPAVTQVLGGGHAGPNAVDRPVADAAVPDAGASVLRAIAAEGGLRRIRMLAWRDLDDPEAGGSELHAHRVARLWAAAGIDVETRTSAVPGAAPVVRRDGYRAVRRSGRYAVFARAGLDARRRRGAPGEALVEVWNGMPFWSPLWYRGPRTVFLHHVHAEMWRMVLPAWLAALGETAERRMAPPVYRSTRIVTLSASSKAEIVDLLGFDPERVSVAPPGVDPRFTPGPDSCRSPTPLVVAVGRLVPVKRFDLLLRALVEAKAAHPALGAVVVGEGYERPRLEALRRSLGATGWISLPGRVADEQLLGWYRRAWVVASASLREGWGMTITEAGACGTPAVATDIAGHRDAVRHGTTGLLAGDDALGAAIGAVLSDATMRRRLGAAARAHAVTHTWEAAARAALEAVVREACLAPPGRARYPLRRPGPLLPHATAPTTASAPRNATATAASVAGSA
jgi:glycosyltransferase involved in cell wall biosynthesis